MPTRGDAAGPSGKDAAAQSKTAVEFAIGPD